MPAWLINKAAGGARENKREASESEGGKEYDRISKAIYYVSTMLCYFAGKMG